MLDDLFGDGEAVLEPPDDLPNMIIWKTWNYLLPFT
jgi:hypothetical protein